MEQEVKFRTYHLRMDIISLRDAFERESDNPRITSVWTSHGIFSK